MRTRTLPVLLALGLVLAACSGGGSGDDVPDDQVIKPVKAPSGWTTTDLETVQVSTPGGWEKQPAQKASETMTSTAFRGPETDGVSSGGMEVRVITKPQQPADEAAKSLGISAMAAMQAGKIDPVEVTWPETKAAYFLEYVAKVPTDPTKPEERSEFPTATLVLDLDDGSQVQVTALAADDPELARQAVATAVSLVPVED